MRYIVDSNNYVTAISFGTEMEYADCICTEYTGMVPSGWDTLEAWYFDEGDKLWRWQIIDGELVMDATATAPEEGDWTKPELQYKTVSPATYTQDVYPDEGYDGLSQVRVYAMSKKTLTTPGISVNENGVVTASVTQASGYVSSSTKTNTHTLSASDDADFVAANIKKGTTIFGLTGSFVGGRIGSSALTSLSSDVTSMSFSLSEGTDKLVGFFIILNGYASKSNTNSYCVSFLLSEIGENVLATVVQRSGSNLYLEPYEVSEVGYDITIDDGIVTIVLDFDNCYFAGGEYASYLLYPFYSE